MTLLQSSVQQSRVLLAPGVKPPPRHAKPQASGRGSSVRANAVIPFFNLADVAPQVAASASDVANQANNLAPGSVEAPTWVIPVAALVVTIGGAASGYLLKPGTEAAEKVFQRDAKRIGNQARAKAKTAGGKAKKAVKKAGRR